TADLPFTGVTTNPGGDRTLPPRAGGLACSFRHTSPRPRIAEAQALPRVPWFDLAVADEALRCAGKVDEAFGTILGSELIRTRRRLFATATPRIASGRLKRLGDRPLADIEDDGAPARWVGRCLPSLDGSD